MLSGTIFKEKEEDTGLCSKIRFDTNSNFRRIIDFVHLLNLLYIAVSIPLLISFDIKMESYLVLLELISLILSAFFIFVNIRTPVHLRGGTTLKIKVVIQHYYNNGLILDLFALWPLNLALGIADVIEPIWIIAPLRLLRLGAVWKTMHIFGRFELFFKKYNLIMHVLRAALFLCIMWHWTSCAWFFTNLYIDREEDFTWMEFNELHTARLYKKVMFSYYTIMNVVSTVGYGDMFPMTDVERLFIVFLIN
jgi:hyperpolarization activated cyclic nucleotide-gated potassium channel 2